MRRVKGEEVKLEDTIEASAMGRGAYDINARCGWGAVCTGNKKCTLSP